MLFGDAKTTCDCEYFINTLLNIYKDKPQHTDFSILSALKASIESKL